MSSLALMRFLESTPQRYDAGMRTLTFGRVTRLHQEVAAAAAPEPGRDVLEIGCGTGSVTLRLVGRGARVTAVEPNAEMLLQARQRLQDAPPGAVQWLERTAAEIDSLPADGFDAVVASLCLSEMSRDERAFVLRAAMRPLRATGLLVVADEVHADRPWQRALQLLTRAPQAALAWLLVGSVSSPIAHLANEVLDAGFRIREERRWLAGSLAMVVAAKP